MRKITICMLVSILSLFLPLLSSGAQTKGIKVVIKDTSGREIGLYKGSHALLIGVSNYTAGWPKLESVPDEINRVEVALKNQGFNVVKVLNPSSGQLENAFEDFIDKYGFDENSRLLFFFSGHGYTRKGGRKGYLVPTDAPDPRYDDKGFLRKAIGMGQILVWAREIEAKHALFLFDSCFSGTVFKAKALPEIPPHISDNTSRPVRQFISAGSAGEEVPANSIFIPLFIRAVRGDGDLDKDGYVTGTELGMYLHKKVLSYDRGQTPQYGKIKDPDLDEGDFVFALKTPSRILPNEPPKSDGIRDYDQLIQQREATKRKWDQWQIGMAESFAKAERYDRSKELKSDEKVEIWTDFLSSYGADNPYSTKDDSLRNKAEQRLNHWKSYKVASLPEKPEYSHPSSSSVREIFPWIDMVNTDIWGTLTAEEKRKVFKGYMSDLAQTPEWKELDGEQKSKVTQGILDDGGLGKLFVNTSPSEATVRILNIRPKFSQGMVLLAGSYHVEVSNPDHNTKKMWVKLESGESKQIEIRLEQLQASIQPTYKPPSSTSNVINRDGIYVAYANGIVKDTNTGLQWKAGPDRDTDWKDARSWVQSLGGGWRMPTTDELKTLYKKGAGDRNMTPLLKTTGWGVWSGETKGSLHAWNFYFASGNGVWNFRVISSLTRAFAVRSRSDRTPTQKFQGKAKPKQILTPSKSSVKGNAENGITIRMYQMAVEEQIKSNWSYPVALISPKKLRDLEAIVLVKVKEDGTVMKSWFKDRSSNSIFDGSVLKAIERSDPLPPFPEGYRKNYDEIEIRFNLSELRDS